MRSCYPVAVPEKNIGLTLILDFSTAATRSGRSSRHRRRSPHSPDFHWLRQFKSASQRKNNQDQKVLGIVAKDQGVLLYKEAACGGGCCYPVAVPEKIIGLTLILDFFDRCHSFGSLLPPPAALPSLPRFSLASPVQICLTTKK